ncbi:MAG TPA: two-component system response regulator CreB [Gammaproteobacteria bacterium]|nr:two-component system response regulator CreB [Gammaproteobacteria bacterium]
MPRILIVEDEPSIAEPLVYVLARDGYAVETLALGAQAAARAGQAPAIDLMVLDVGLPDLGGFEVCRAVRRGSDLPILFLTARGEEIDRVVGLELGADDYVVKPFSPREVVARIRNILRRRATPTGKASTALPFVLDRERAQVLYHGRELALTRYEYLLLALLAERPGKVYTRDEIMDALWPQASGSMDRTVDTHVKTLRAKFREVRPEADPVRTHRGLGYSFTPPA